MKLLALPHAAPFKGALLRWQSHIYAGGTPSKEVPAYWEDGTIPWLASGEINKRKIESAEQFITKTGYANSSARWVPPHSALIALAGQGKTKGMVATLEFRATCNQSLAAIVPRPHLDYNFLAYYLESRYLDIRALVGEMRDGLNLEIVGSIEVPFLPLATQGAIAAFLDQETARLDGLVAQKEKLLALLEEKRVSLIIHAVTRGLNPHAPTKPSGILWLGHIPEHWNAERIKWVAKMHSGHTPDKKVAEYWQDGDIPWVSLNDTAYLKGNDYIAETAYSTTQAGIANSSAVLLPPRVVVFSRDATIGRCAITTRPMAVSQHFIAWECTDRLIP